jgi:hypothetical protein
MVSHDRSYADRPVVFVDDRQKADIAQHIFSAARCTVQCGVTLSPFRS